jgi:outer membrane protein OmpA-like peptidoglycan-associated protein
MKKVVFLLLLGLLFFALTACSSPPPPAPPPEPAAEPAPPPPSPPPPPPSPPPVEDPPPVEAPPPPREDTEGPVLRFSTPIKYFSPDGDGENDIYIATLSAGDESAIAGWSIDIREPVAPYVLFGHFEAAGAPPSHIEWDGKNPQGELVQSASDYLVTFTVTDVKGNRSVLEGVLETDILVIREGNRLKAQVPSIVFPPEKGSFDGLDEDTLSNNERILRRVAAVLNKFRDYKVSVEGHANAVKRTPQEESRELKPLSELRARAVVEELVRYGVDRSRLSSVGMGGSQPVVPYENRDGWWKNRRVEFILIK